MNYLFIKELESRSRSWGAEPELVDKCLIAPELEPELVNEYLIAPELEPELVLFYSGSPALISKCKYSKFIRFRSKCRLKNLLYLKSFLKKPIENQLFREFIWIQRKFRLIKHYCNFKLVKSSSIIFI